MKASFRIIFKPRVYTLYMEYRIKRGILISATIILLVILYTFKNYSLALRITAFLFSIYTLYAIDKLFNVRFKIIHYVLFLLVLTFSLLFSPMYFISEYYDKLLHLFLPIIISILVFFMINRLKIEFRWKILMTFTTLITLLTLFEIGEFALDKLFDLKLQGVYLRDISGIAKYNILMDKNDDTMIDLILGIIGSFSFCVFKYAERYYTRRKFKELYSPSRK